MSQPVSVDHHDQLPKRDIVGQELLDSRRIQQEHLEEAARKRARAREGLERKLRR
jgi:hypothetical protein